MHEFFTLEADTNIRQVVSALGEDEIQARIAAGDLIAIETKYHKKCSTALHNRYCGHLREEKRKVAEMFDNEERMSDRSEHKRPPRPRLERVIRQRIVHRRVDLNRSQREIRRGRCRLPSTAQKGPFTVAAVDNLDYNASSNTATPAFQVNGISLFQNVHGARPAARREEASCEYSAHLGRSPSSAGSVNCSAIYGAK